MAKIVKEHDVPDDLNCVGCEYLHDYADYDICTCRLWFRTLGGTKERIGVGMGKMKYIKVQPLQECINARC